MKGEKKKEKRREVGLLIINYGFQKSSEKRNQYIYLTHLVFN